MNVTSIIQSIALDKLFAHPDNPNEMSKINFGKLVRNIERTGRYEPIVVRPHPEKNGCFQIINGHHRCHGLAKLGYTMADCIVWDVDDEQTDILLATLNRLGGSDQIARKLALLKRLNKRMDPSKLSKLMPQTKRQIERLTNLKVSSRPMMSERSPANPMVFFVNDAQQQTIEKALSLATGHDAKMSKALNRAAALTCIAGSFLKTTE